jgi:FMN phosphatase YigB (HAD superfamily)
LIFAPAHRTDGSVSLGPANVLLDIGVVLLHLDYARALERLARFCPPERRRGGPSFLALLGRDDAVAVYERGGMSAAEFFAHVVRLTGFSGSMAAFVDIWRDIFAENEPMIRFGRELAATRKVYFATNAGDLHVPWIFERFPSLRFFTDCACSCYLGASKPSAEFFDRALARFGLEPGACLFVDDRPENVAGAEAAGIRSILYAGPDQAVQAVRAALADSP